MSDFQTVAQVFDEKEHIEIVSQFSEEIQNQVNTYDGQVQDGTAVGLVPAVVSYTLTFADNNGHYSGWITYPDHSKLRVYGKVDRTNGLPFAGGNGVPILVWPREALLGRTARFTAAGSWGGGALLLSIDSVPISHPWPLLGAGAFGWGCSGNCRFTAQ